jgi:hypothetical protein
MVVYDLEIFKNLFTYTDKHVQTGEIKQFVVHESRDDRKKMIFYLLSGIKQVGFNNLRFDYPLLFYILSNEGLYYCDVDTFISCVYEKAQNIIESEYSIVPKWKEKNAKISIPQLDLYAINHFDNGAKRTSLKDLQFYMRMDNIQDLPYQHDEKVTDVQTVLDYNLHDVEATLMFFNKCKDAVKMRIELSKQYGIDLINANDPKIGSEIFVNFIAEKTKQSVEYIKTLRTPRDIIKLGDLILPYIEYKSKPLQEFLEKLKSTTVTNDKTFSERVIYKEFPYDFGVGGIHGCIKPGIYRPNDDEFICTSDVSSYYPNLSIRNRIYPEHLGEVFCDIYEEVYNTRSKAKKEGNKTINEGLKLAINGVYGKSGDEYSPFYDKKFMYFITVNGQLLLTMLSEQLQDAGFKPLMINTDGFEFIVPKNKINIYNDLCSKWEQQTQLELEHDHYSVMCISNVNNYIAKTTSGKVKQKGLYEIEKQYHKDTSFTVVPIALEKYILDNIPIHKTITEHKDIYDFCGRIKSNSGYEIQYRYLNVDQISIDELQKTNRAYISNSGGYLYKTKESREEKVYSGYKVQMMNKMIIKQDYDINYDWYIRECYKIIDEIEQKQLSLF